MIGATLGAAAISYMSQRNASNKAASASKNATNAAMAQQQRQYSLNKQNQAPYLQAGQQAIGTMQALNAGDMSGFHASPDYQFTLDQGIKGLDRSAAARGSLLSGGHSADVLNYATGLADQQYGNFYNRLAGLAGAGQRSAESLGGAGQNMANSTGNLLLGNAGAQGQNYYNQSNALGNLLGQGVQAFGQYSGNQPLTGNVQIGMPTAQPIQRLSYASTAPHPSFTAPNVGLSGGLN